MKKRNWLRVGSVCMALIMALGMTGCSRSAKNGGDSGKASQSADNSLAKQFVFSAKELELGFEADDMRVCAVRVTDDRVNTIVQIYDWESNNSNNDLRLVSFDKAGENVQTVNLKFPETTGDTSIPESEEMENAPEAPVEGGDGEMHILEETADAVETAVTEEAIEGDYDLEEEDYYDPGYSDDEYYNLFAISDNDYLYAIHEIYHSDWTDPDNYVYESSYELCSWDTEGNFLWNKPLDELKETDEDSYSVASIVPMEDGSLVLLVRGNSTSYKLELDAEGNVQTMKELKGAGSKLADSYELMDKGDGLFLLTYYDDSYTDMYLATYDIVTDTIKDEIKLPQVLSYGGYNTMVPGAASDIIYSDSTGIWRYSAGDEAAAQIMSYVNSDLIISYLNKLIMIDEDHFIAFYNEETADSYRSVAALFTRRNPEDIPDKQVLTLAANYLGSDVRAKVVEFNKKSDQYRIVTKEYDSYNTAEDYMASYTQLNNDIISGNMPDILVYDSWFPIDNYVNKGLLADVDELIAGDEELSKQEYMDNVFEAYRVKGKLYTVIPAFTVETVIGKTSVVGDRTSWSFKDLQELMASLPEGTESFGEMTKSNFISQCLTYCGSNFVDVSTGKCNFDSEDFIDMLKFANTFPEEINYDDNYSDDAAWENYWQNYQSQYRDNRTVLRNEYIYELRQMVYDVNGCFGEDVSYIGFPTQSGQGSVVSLSGTGYALSAKSANLDAAWDFVKYCLTEDYQKNVSGLPILKSEFMNRAQLATQKNFYMEGDEKIEYDDTYDINGESIVIEPLTKAQVNKLVDFIESVKTKEYYNDDITNIVNEEAAGFFAGQKSAEEVAKIIQSRAQIFIDENR